MSHGPGEAPSNPEEAFDYLKSVETPTIADYKIIALLEAAGFEAYKFISEGTDHEGVRKLLAKNGQEEMAHAHRVRRVIKAVWDEDFELPAAEANPYMARMERLPITKKYLEALAEVEFSGEDFYESWAAKLGHPEAERLLRQNGKEETRHGERLREAAALLA